MKGYSVYVCKNRPSWYICYFSAETLRWKSAATEFRVDDPAGRRKAVRLAEMKAREFKLLAGENREHAWSNWVRSWLEKRYGRQPNTCTRYLNAWDWLNLFFDESKLPTPARVRYQHAADYLAWRQQKPRRCGRPVGRNTALLELRILGVIVGEAKRRGYCFENPFEKMGLARARPKEKAELTDHEIATLRAGVREKEGALPVTQRWMTVCLEIALHQGCRLSETSVPMASVDEARGTIQLTAKGRNGVPNIFTTALHPGLFPLMKELRAAGATQTCHLPRMAGKEWWKLRRDLGLQHTTFHATRVTVITRMARAGVPIQQAMRFVGHADESVHRIYQKLHCGDLAACTAALQFAEVQ